MRINDQHLLSISYSTKLSGVQSKTKMDHDQSSRKYYFNNKTKIETGLTERKQPNGITISISQRRSKSRSYRVHTIDHAIQDNKEITTHKTINRKAHRKGISGKCKENVRKSTIEANIFSFVTLTREKSVKEREKERKKESREGFTIQLRAAQKSKAKTQFEENEHISKQENLFRDPVSQRKNMKNHHLRKIEFRNNKIRSLRCQSQRETINMKSIQQDVHDSSTQQLIPKQKKPKDSFKEYVEFIGRKEKSIKKQSQYSIGSKENKLCNLGQDELTEKKTHQSNTQQMDSNQKSCFELDFSEIPEINQSSFLSSKGKKEILLSPTLETRHAALIRNQGQRTEQEKKRVRKREAKLSVYFRDVKQMFPDKFFG